MKKFQPNGKQRYDPILCNAAYYKNSYLDVFNLICNVQVISQTIMNTMPQRSAITGDHAPGQRLCAVVGNIPTSSNCLFLYNDIAEISTPKAGMDNDRTKTTSEATTIAARNDLNSIYC